MGYDSRDYKELSETNYDELIDNIRGTIKIGNCCYAGCNGKMRYDTNCFICDTCKHSVYEDTYYYWYTGGTDDIVWDDYDEHYQEGEDE
ncbi:MAG: hypothetical protein PHS74_00560 [Lachnospiraceae bacterium]|nr:hypothetical protein [Lachnospiraceae bacterium]